MLHHLIHCLLTQMPLHTHVRAHNQMVIQIYKRVRKLAVRLLYLLITQGQEHTHRHAFSHERACCQNCRSPHVCS